MGRVQVGGFSLDQLRTTFLKEREQRCIRDRDMTGLGDLKSPHTAMSAPMKKPHTDAVTKCVTLEHTAIYQHARYTKHTVNTEAEYCSHIILYIC